MKYLPILAILVYTSSLADILPNPHLTPGVTRDGISASDLCPVAHTSNVRNVPESEKLEVYKSYGMDKPRIGYCSGPSGCEIDHLISLELGGSNDQKNLWPEPYDGKCSAHDKDKLENKLHSLVCAGNISLVDAQNEIRLNWITAYQKYVGPLQCEGEVK